jgi:uncharacterized protein with PQ loop repeat
MNELQIAAGSLSSILFITSSLPMVTKAIRTHNLRSYSLANILLANLGNLVYWIYVLALPVGPVWFLHGFNTLVAVVMLALYLRHRAAADTGENPHSGK